MWLAPARDTPDRAAAWLDGTSCESVERRNGAAGGLRGFAERAEAAERIICNKAGGALVYYRFASRDALDQAWAAEPEVRREWVCVDGPEVVVMGLLVNGEFDATRELCDELGAVLRSPTSSR